LLRSPARLLSIVMVAIFSMGQAPEAPRLQPAKPANHTKRDTRILIHQDRIYLARGFKARKLTSNIAIVVPAPLHHKEVAGPKVDCACAASGMCAIAVLGGSVYCHAEGCAKCLLHVTPAPRVSGQPQLTAGTLPPELRLTPRPPRVH